MGCCFASPNQDKAKSEDDPNYFGQFREGVVWTPDNINRLRATYFSPELPLYSAKIDQGAAFKALTILNYLMPCYWAYDIYKCALNPIKCLLFCDGRCDMTSMCNWVRKEYSTRTIYYVYENRIVITSPKLRFPWALMGCGSWNIDHYVVNVFDRGAFGFRTIKCGTLEHFCWIYRPFGGVIGRQRCPCNGSIYPRMFSDCGGCWCEEWVCNYCGCLFVYHGLADPDEAAFASNIALQAYFEGRKLTIQEMNKCVEYFKDLIAPKPPPPHNLRGTTFLFRFLLAIFDFIRSVLKGEIFYRMTHPVRKNPFVPPTSETTRVYDLHTEDRVADLDRFHNKQMHDYSVPKCLGCDRWFGRRGVCFCTEDITNCFTHKKKTVAPPHETPLAYDQGEYSAADILRRVVGPPPKENVHRTGPYALGGDQSSHRLGDEESGSFAQIDMNNSTDDMTAEMARTMSVSQQPMYTPKSEYVELKRDESNDVELPV